MKEISRIEISIYGNGCCYEVGNKDLNHCCSFDEDRPIVDKIEEVQIQTNPDFRQTYYIVSLSNGEIIEISALCATIVTYREV